MPPPPPSDLLPRRRLGLTAAVMSVPLWDGIISGGQLRDWLHLPCHRMEGGGRGREVDGGEVLGGGGRSGWEGELELAQAEGRRGSR